MKQKNTVPVPEEIIELQRQLNEFRSAHRPRTKLPESLWQAAVELARRHGLYPVAHPLRLDYMGLKKRVGETTSVQQKIRKRPEPTFVELISPVPAPGRACPG
jgi:hypothetical protein